MWTPWRIGCFLSSSKVCHAVPSLYGSWFREGLFAFVDPSAPKGAIVIGTGHGSVKEGWSYIDSVIQDPFVWHFYWEKL